MGDVLPGKGFLSSRRELHVSAIGLAAGVAAALAGRPDLLVAVVAICLGIRAAPGKLQVAIEKEPWYACGFAVAGYAGVVIGPKVVDVVGSVI